MVYRVIGLVCGNTAEGVDIVFTELHENGGKWSYEISQVASYPYPEQWAAKLDEAVDMKAPDYSLLHNEFGEYIGSMVNEFIDKNELHFKIALVAVKGYPAFDDPGQQLNAEIGNGAVIAAKTKLPVVTNLRAIDTALGGKGKGWTAIGEKLLFGSQLNTSDPGAESVQMNATENEFIQYKESLTIALMGVLRWREETNLLAAFTGASSDSVGGAMWMGMEP